MSCIKTTGQPVLAIIGKLLISENKSIISKTNTTRLIRLYYQNNPFFTIFAASQGAKIDLSYINYFSLFFAAASSKISLAT